MSHFSHNVPLVAGVSVGHYTEIELADTINHQPSRSHKFPSSMGFSRTQLLVNRIHTPQSSLP